MPLAALAYFLAAPALPALPAGDATTIVAGGVGLVAIAAMAIALVQARETVVWPLLIAAGAGLLVGGLNAGGVGAGANVAEALLAASAGLLLARVLGTPAVAVAVPLFVAAIDLWSVLDGPATQLLAEPGDRVDALAFDLPAWGASGTAGSLGVSDAVFLAMFAAWAWRFGFRRRATAIGMAAGLLAALVLGVVLDAAVPALPLIALGYLAPNVGRLPALLRSEAAAPSRS